MTRERVLITGASAGIGAALAKHYAKRQARILLFARDEGRLRSVAKDVGGIAFVGDVTDATRLAEAVQHAQQAWGGLDVVIANAGFARTGSFTSLSCDDYRHQFDVNVFGVISTIKASLPLLRESQGRIAVIGSVAGTVSTPGCTAYAMSKAALRPLANGLRMELAGSGISVTLITPGLIVSSIRDRDHGGMLISQPVGRSPSWFAMPTDQAAKRMVRAIDRRQREAVITGHARALLLAWHWLPWLVRPFLAKDQSWNT